MIDLDERLDRASADLWHCVAQDERELAVPPINRPIKFLRLAAGLAVFGVVAVSTVLLARLDVGSGPRPGSSTGGAAMPEVIAGNAQGQLAQDVATIARELNWNIDLDSGILHGRSYLRPDGVRQADVRLALGENMGELLVGVSTNLVPNPERRDREQDDRRIAAGLGVDLIRIEGDVWITRGIQARGISAVHVLASDKNIYVRSQSDGQALAEEDLITMAMQLMAKWPNEAVTFDAGTVRPAVDALEASGSMPSDWISPPTATRETDFGVVEVGGGSVPGLRCVRAVAVNQSGENCAFVDDYANGSPHIGLFGPEVGRIVAGVAPLSAGVVVEVDNVVSFPDDNGIWVINVPANVSQVWIDTTYGRWRVN
jgi:hypothetical protein